MTSALSRRNEGTTAVITGGAQGVGLAIALQLADEGCRRIAIAGRDGRTGEAALAELRSRGVDAVFVATDLAVVADCHRLIDTSVAHFGAVNALVNAAASAARGTLLELTPEMWDEMFNVNARGPCFLMQRFVRHLVDTGRPGSIVNILSQCAHCGQSYLTQYSASKGALATLTRNTANALLADRIRVNGLNIGWMNTPGEHVTQTRFHDAPDDWLERASRNQPFGRLLEPAEVARTIAFLASDESGMMTGSVVDFDQTVVGTVPDVPRF